jgi:hypothetical protein
MVKEILASRKYLLNIILAAAAAGIMVFYSLCTTSCSYLKGDLLGLDLKYVGIFFMMIIIALSAMKQDLFLLILLSGSVGVEIFLVIFQVKADLYCPFCLAFGVILLLMFFLNMDLHRKRVMALCIVLGYLSFLLFFVGTVTAKYEVTLRNSTSMYLM